MRPNLKPVGMISDRAKRYRAAYTSRTWTTRKAIYGPSGRANMAKKNGLGLETAAYFLKGAFKKKNPAKFDRCVKAVKKKGGARNAYAVCKASTSAKNRATAALQSNLKKRKVVRHNPGDDAEAARYEYFHGRPPAEVITIRTPVHDPLNVKHSGIGKLMALEILSIDGTKKVTLERFKGTLLSQDKKGKQLYIDGGDQSARLSDFGIRYPHELEILGALLAVVYFTTKDHLRAEDGGTANYDHKFGGEGKQKRFVFGQHGSRLPLVGYDVRDKLLSIQGGGYELPAEGIDG